MNLKVKALIVGGGVVGVSIAYHLAKMGWKDILLLERDELTAGSTWHAAGLLPLFNMSYATSHIHDYSVKLYKTLQEETGLDPGFRVVGNLRMAQTKERIDEFQLYASTASTVGINFEWLTPSELKKLYPLVRTEGLLGAIYHPEDGYINPSDLTQALAKGARMQGVSIKTKYEVDRYQWNGRNWVVQGFLMEDKGGVLIRTDQLFKIEAEHVVTATGNFAQRTARQLGIKLPTIPVEHQYIVTEPDPQLLEWRKSNPEHPVLRDADAKWYVREERGGWILGPYEKGAPARFLYDVPKHFRADLFELDLDRIEAEYESMIHRIPSSEHVGLKNDFNGPICYTPDGNPLVGSAYGLKNLWLAEGFSFGITAAGGTGYYLAQMMVEGEAEIDMASLDPKRFGNWITTNYSKIKNEECYEHVYILHHPDEERESARPLRTSPCYDRVRKLGAKFGQVNGWERPNYFATLDFDDHASRSFRKGSWVPYAIREAITVREQVGLYDATAFNKLIIKGDSATAFLDWFTCNRLPQIGRVNLTYALTNNGTIRSEYTIARISEKEYYLISAGAWASYDTDYLLKCVEDFQNKKGHLVVQDVTTQYGVFVLAGPNSRNLLKNVVFDSAPDELMKNTSFPWMSIKNIEIGMCPVNAMRVSYTGSSGWELHHPIEMQNYLFDKIFQEGSNHELKLFGARAQNWLRLEKSYRAFGSDLGRDATPLEAGLERFVDLSKEFIGKQQMIDTGIRSKCVTILIEGPNDAMPWGREALYSEGKRIGRLTSGGWSVHCKTSIGLGYVPMEFSKPGTKLQVRMFEKMWNAKVSNESPYDPSNSKLKE